MTQENKQLMEDIYLHPDIWYDLSDENQAIALDEMQQMYNRLTDSSDLLFEHLRETISALAGLTQLMHRILNS